MITGRCYRYMYINARKQLGKDSYMNTWQLSERETYSQSQRKSSENQYQGSGPDEKNQES